MTKNHKELGKAEYLSSINSFYITFPQQFNALYIKFISFIHCKINATQMF